MKAKDYVDLLEQTLVSFMTTMGPDYVFQHCYVNISLYNEKLELFVTVALLLAGTVYTVYYIYYICIEFIYFLFICM